MKRLTRKQYARLRRAGIAPGDALDLGALRRYQAGFSHIILNCDDPEVVNLARRMHADTQKALDEINIALHGED